MIEINRLVDVNWSKGGEGIKYIFRCYMFFGANTINQLHTHTCRQSRGVSAGRSLLRQKVRPPAL